MWHAAGPGAGRVRLGAGHAVAAAACSCQRVRAYGCRRVRLACDELCSARLQGSGAGCSRLPSKAAGCNCICDALQHLASQAAPFCPAGTSCCRCTSNNNKPSPPPADSPASPAASAPPADGGTPSSDPAAASPPLEASAPPASGGVVVPAEQTAQAIGVFYFASTTVYQKGAEVTLNRTLDEAASSGALLSSMQGVTGEPGGGGGMGRQRLVEISGSRTIAPGALVLLSPVLLSPAACNRAAWLPAARCQQVPFHVCPPWLPVQLARLPPAGYNTLLPCPQARAWALSTSCTWAAASGSLRPYRSDTTAASTPPLAPAQAPTPRPPPLLATTRAPSLALPWARVAPWPYCSPS